ncbi:MAG: caspase family protein [Planctomycetaceae bacterium]|nr:caspase family protein [Planctomycetaceae bacterium]
MREWFMRRRLVVLHYCLAGLISATTVADDDVPILALDAGGHTSVIRDVLFTPDGKQLISASDDKTIRVWDVASGQTLHVIRPSIGTGSVGMIYAAAISPDGDTLAIGGYGSPEDDYGPVTLISLSRQQITRRMLGHTDAVQDLAFSSDGSRLASGSSDGTVRIWNLESGESEHTFEGHKKDVYGVVFSPDGELLATGSYDGTGAVWSVRTGERQAVLSGHTDAIQCIDWSHDGTKIVTGSYDQTIRIWDKQGNLNQTFNDFGENLVAVIKFVPNDTQLLFSSMSLQGTVKSGLLNPVTGQLEVEYTGKAAACLRANISPGGTTVAAGGATGIIELLELATGKTIQSFTGSGASKWAAGWSPDGTSIAWGERFELPIHNNFRPLDYSFDVTTLQWGDAISAEDPRSWQRASTEQLSTKLVPSGKTIVDVRNGEQVVAQLKPDESDQDTDIVASYSVLPDNRAVVGSSFSLSIHDLTSGRLLQECKGHQSMVLGVAPSSDGRYLLSASGDMTVRIWNIVPPSYTGLGVYLKQVEEGLQVTGFVSNAPALLDGRLKRGDVILSAGSSKDDLHPAKDVKDLAVGKDETIWLNVRREGNDTPLDFDLVGDTFPIYRDLDPLLSLFFAGDDWIAWTPQGYYAASPGGERLMGWHINNGHDKLASFYPAAQFHKQFYRPDVIKLLLKTGSVAAALEKAGTHGPVQSIAASLPPVVEIVSPSEPNVMSDDAEITVRVRATQRGDNPITAVQLLIDGRPLDGKAGEKQVDGESQSVTHRFYVPLIPGVEHVIQAKADSTASHALSNEIHVTYRSATVAPTLPRLYVLAIGVADYDVESLKLNFADDDARRLAKTFQEQAVGLYRSVDTKLIVDKEATQKGILAGLIWLKQQMTQHDVGVLFFSGHGDRDELGNLYLLPCDVDPENPLLLSGVPDAQIKSVLQGTPGRMIVMLDACHAGSSGGDRRKAVGAPTDDLVRDLATDDYGVVVMASSMGQEFSLESPDNQNGMFTLAVCEGLEGKADTNKDTHVYFNELDLYVTDRVKELTGGKQHPVTAKPTTIRSFPLTTGR